MVSARFCFSLSRPQLLLLYSPECGSYASLSAETPPKAEAITSRNRLGPSVLLFVSLVSYATALCYTGEVALGPVRTALPPQLTITGLYSFPTTVRPSLPFNFLTLQACSTTHSTLVNMIVADKPLDVVLKDDHVLVNEDLRISFRRTIRVPDNQQTSLLPPDLRTYPLLSVNQHAGKMKAEMVAKGGLFFPMYRKCKGKS